MLKGKNNKQNYRSDPDEKCLRLPTKIPPRPPLIKGGWGDLDFEFSIPFFAPAFGF
jgi:hypothetical protein